MILEVVRRGPSAGSIVWQWHAWDHLVQDFDSTKPNYGSIAASPHRVDVNYPPKRAKGGDWLHVNGIDYNPALDQIAISAHNTNEIWVVDHSTTTTEAATSSGGRSGKGGDILYRWGNPLAYRSGTAADQQLFGQHDPNWIEPGSPGADNILIFNNGLGRPGGRYSTVVEITPPPPDPNGNYAKSSGAAWGPAAPAWMYQHPNRSTFYSLVP